MDLLRAIVQHGPATNEHYARPDVVFVVPTTAAPEPLA